MIPNETPQTIETVGPTNVVGNFKITEATQARILVSLSDKMYTRKQLAAIREYSTNAADAHKVVGKPISEVVVTLPTMNDLNLRIRDFGTGLTEDQIRNVYCIFGESTKRNSNEFNGLLGYGCKAGFASADSFIVTSWINGQKTVYQCIKGDSTKLHSAIRLSQEVSIEPSGIEITIPVKQTDMWTFHNEAVDFYKYWPELPTFINLTDSAKERLNNFRSIPATLKGEGWEIRPAINGARGIAYMGWVPYQIDWQTLYHRMSLDSKSRVLFDLLQKNEVTFYFTMGEVQFVDSREHLEYTELTLNVLTERIRNVFSKIKEAIQEKFEPLENIWEAKKMYNAIFGTGILETEKGENVDPSVSERIKILDGNLMNLEVTFRGAFTWKGISIDGPDFSHINRFDNFRGAVVGYNSNNPVEPVMVTYRKKKLRAKVNRCRAEAANKIVASDNVAVVLNDVNKRSGLSLVSRYVIFGLNKNIKTVHILNFKDAAIQALFNSEYKFDSVPVMKMSELLPLAKQWNGTNKVSRTYGGGGGGARMMRYLDFDTMDIEESEVPIREIEAGNFFIEVVDNGTRAINRKVRMSDNDSKDPDEIISDVETVVRLLDLDINRVYIINKQTHESKWFKEAVDCGDWTNLWAHIKEALEDVNKDELLCAESYGCVVSPCQKAADYLKKNVMDKNSPILKILAHVGDTKQKENLQLVYALKGLWMWTDYVGTQNASKDYSAIDQEVRSMYPFLSWNWIQDELYANPNNLKTVLNYVNASDMYDKLVKNDLLSALLDCNVTLCDNCPSTKEAVNLSNENTSVAVLA